MPRSYHSVKVFLTAVVLCVSSLYAQVAPSSSFTLKDDFAGDVYQIGDIITVEWEAAGDNITGAVVWLSADGTRWVELNPDGVIRPDDPEWGKVEWTIQEKPFADGFGRIVVVGDSVRIRIVDDDNSDIVTYSDYFSIEGEVSIQSVSQRLLPVPNITLTLKPSELIINNVIGVAAKVSVCDLSGKTIGEFLVNQEVKNRFAFDRELSNGTYAIRVASMRKEQHYSEVFMRLIP